MIKAKKTGKKREEDQLKDPIADGIQQAAAAIFDRLSKKGFLAGVKPSDEGLPRGQKLSESDLGQGRKFIRPLGALYRQVMTEEDEEDKKEDSSVVKARKVEKDQLKDPVADGIREATAAIFDRLSKKGFLIGVKPIDGDNPEKPWDVSESWRQRAEEAEEAFRQSGLDYRDQEALGNILFPYWDEFIAHLAREKVADEWDKLKPEEKIVRADSLAPDWNFQQFGLAVLAGYLAKKIEEEERSA